MFVGGAQSSEHPTRVTLEHETENRSADLSFFMLRLGTFMLRRFSEEIQNVSRIVPLSTTCRYLACVGGSLPAIASARKLWPADLKMRARVRVRYEGTDLNIDCGQLDRIVPEQKCSTFSGIREMYARNVYLRLFDLARIKWEVAIDAGGNRGMFTVFLSQLCRDVVYIEPQLHFRQALQLLLRDNPSSCKVHIENVCLGGARAAGLITVPEVLSKYGLSCVTFCKCDVEGDEFDIFLTDNSWLKSVDNIAMEVHRHAGNPHVLVQALVAYGFCITARDAGLRPVDPEHADYICASRTGALL